MKRCPECRRDYYDDTLKFCLDDGAQLLDGPRASENATELFVALRERKSSDLDTDGGNAVTQIMPSNAAAGGLFRRKRLLLAGVLGVVILVGLFTYVYISKSYSETESTIPAVPAAPAKLYWEMSDDEKWAFIRERAKHVQRLIGDEEAELENGALLAIKEEVEDYVEDKDSLSQKPFEEGLRAIYGRATQFAPIVIRSFDGQKVPAALGLYQAMIESEYHDCPEQQLEHPGRPPVGLFQFSRQTAALYGMKPANYCDVQKQCEAAARHMSDLISDFGSEKSSWTLALLSFNEGGEKVRDYLRQLRSRGITERSYWAIFRHQGELQSPMTEEANRYVPRFFAAAIIGETPGAFDLSTPPLTAMRK